MTTPRHRLLLLGFSVLLGARGVRPVQALPDEHFSIRTDLDSVRALARFLPGGETLGSGDLRDISQGLNRLGRERRRIEGETLAFLPGRGLVWGDPSPPEASPPPRPEPEDSPDPTPPEAPDPGDGTPCPEPEEILLDLDLAVSHPRRRRLERRLEGRVSPGLMRHLRRFQVVVCPREAVLTTSFTEAGAAQAAENVAEGLLDFVSGQLGTWGPGLARILTRNKLFGERTRERLRKILESPATRQWIEALDPTVVGDRLILIIRP